MAAKKIVRYSENPFLKDMIVPIGHKQVKVSNLGKDDNVLINQATGEINGTHVVTYKKVDKQQFTKLFAQNIALTFNLNAAGIKAFSILIWAIQNRGLAKDLLTLDQYTLEDFLKENNDREPPLKLSIATFRRGLSDLVTAQIIAMSKRKSWYYINPNFVFNGDRIAFTTLIEKNNGNEVPLQTEPNFSGPL